MILVAHPFGNANVRAVLSALNNAERLSRFVTTVGWSTESPVFRGLPDELRSRAARRSYDLPHYKIKVHPSREILRHFATKFKLNWLLEHERGRASIDRVWTELDAFAADYLRKNHERHKITAVYAYEDCAERLFETARELGLRRVYDLPIAYWETAQRLLGEEAQRYPEWEPTLIGTRDSPAKLARKTRELDLAEAVICPSAFVLESLPAATRESKSCVVVPFGSPPSAEISAGDSRAGRPLRVLFAGALTQRKGLADLFAAMKLLRTKSAELVVMGTALQPLAWYRKQFPDLIYEAPRAHEAVLDLMRSCDLLALPSIVEGRALVQQEAMACGLPLIATRNAGGDDLIIEGETGFLVPIRSPQALAEKIDWCAGHRAEVRGMGLAAQKRAAELTWDEYGAKVVHAIESLH